MMGSMGAPGGGKVGDLGPELWVGTPPVVDASWTNNLDGSFTSAGGTGFVGWNTGKCVTGKTYESSFRVVSRVAGSASGPYDGAGANRNPEQSAPDVYTKRFVALVTGPLYIYGNAFSGTVDSLSLREVL